MWRSDYTQTEDDRGPEGDYMQTEDALPGAPARGRRGCFQRPCGARDPDLSLLVQALPQMRAVVRPRCEAPGSEWLLTHGQI